MTGEVFVDHYATRFYDIDIGCLAVPTDIVNVSARSVALHQPGGAAMIADVRPIPDLAAVAVNPQRLTPQDIDDDERNQLFGELVGTVAIRTIRHTAVQPVDFMIGTHQLIRRGLGGRTGRIGRVRRRFVNARGVDGRGSVHIVRRHMVGARRRPIGANESGAAGAQEVMRLESHPS
jgi:hypothetical protein